MTDEEFSLLEQQFYEQRTNETAAAFLEAGFKYFIPDADISAKDFEFEVLDSVTQYLRGQL